MKKFFLSKPWLGLIIIFALAHPVLRWSGMDFLTPIRIIILVCFVIALRNNRVQISALVLAGTLIFEVAKGALWSGITYEQLIFTGHFFLLIAFLFVLGRYFTRLENQRRYEDAIGVMVLTATAVVVSSVFEYLVGWSWPNTESGKGVTSVFYNVNDYSAFLVSYVALSIAYFESESGTSTKKLVCIIGIVLAFAIIIINGSRAALAGTLFILFGWGVSICLAVFKSNIASISGGMYTKKRHVTIFVFFLLCFVLILLLPIWNQNFYQQSIKETWGGMASAVSTASWHILHLEYTGINIGSINDRINAAVFAIKNLLGTYGLGIGLGKSKEMIVASGITYNASSLHFFALQILVEMGIIGTLTIFWSIKHACANYRKTQPLGMFFVICIFIFAGASQSEGFVSNFGTWGVMLYLFFFWRPDAPSCHNKQKTIYS